MFAFMCVSGSIHSCNFVSFTPLELSVTNSGNWTDALGSSACGHLVDLTQNPT